MAKQVRALRNMFSRKSSRKTYEGKGEEFLYWERYMMLEKAKVRGPEIKRTLVGYKKRQINDWYYDENPPDSAISQRRQIKGKMPLIKPIKEWSIYLGDKVEIQVGRDKGKVGEVVELVKERNWCFVEGLHLEYRDLGESGMKPHLRDLPMIRKIEKPLLVTHEVKLVDPSDLRATEFEWRYTEEGERVRVSVRSGRIIPIPQRHHNTWEDTTKAYQYKPSSKDTTVSHIEKETYEPKLCTFEEDVLSSMGIIVDVDAKQKRRKRGYWY